jgi:hypothetical protein
MNHIDESIQIQTVLITEESQNDAESVTPRTRWGERLVFVFIVFFAIYVGSFIALSRYAWHLDVKMGVPADFGYHLMPVDYEKIAKNKTLENCELSLRVFYAPLAYVDRHFITGLGYSGIPLFELSASSRSPVSPQEDVTPNPETDGQSKHTSN